MRSLIPLLCFSSLLLCRFAGAQSILLNASFERDEFNLRAERAYIEGGRDAHCFQSDRMADSWNTRGAVRWIHTGSQHGESCMAVGNRGTIAQSFSAYSGTPMGGKRNWRAVKSVPIRRPERLFGTVRFSVFARAEKAGQKLALTIQLGRLASKKQVFDVNEEWSKFEVVLSAKDQVAAWKKKPQVPHTIAFTAGALGDGEIFLDTAAASEETGDAPNLIYNPGFDRRVTTTKGSFYDDGPDGYPSGWSRPLKYSVHPPQHYYIWTGWHHYFSEIRGRAELDTMLSHGGSRSLRMSVLPGDEMYVESIPIVIHQKEPAYIKVSMYVRADRLRDFDIQAVNEDGRYLWGTPWTDYGGGIGAGTHDWLYVRKYFCYENPIRELRVRICARGMNGSTRDFVAGRTYPRPASDWPGRTRRQCESVEGRGQNSGGWTSTGKGRTVFGSS